MAKYYVNKNAQANGDHEVHIERCDYMPLSHNRIYLGEFTNCKDAVKKGQDYYSKVNGCYYCSNSCHSS